MLSDNRKEEVALTESSVALLCSAAISASAASAAACALSSLASSMNQIESKMKFNALENLMKGGLAVLGHPDVPSCASFDK